jgi:hypothetical protein
MHKHSAAIALAGPWVLATSSAVALTGLLVLATAALAEPSPAPDAIGSYPLDAIARVLSPGAPLPCRGLPLVRYRGELVRYERTARVHPAFKPRLQAFEALLVQTAIAHYGRAPRQLLHLGTHNCRRMRLYPDWLSEHALGNAIDVAGFAFPRLARDATLPTGVPASLRGRFEVRIDRHWNTARGPGAAHRDFLHDLARRIIARPDLFRVVLGPAWPGHHNHFHLDAAPYRVTQVF